LDQEVLLCGGILQKNPHDPLTAFATGIMRVSLGPWNGGRNKRRMEWSSFIHRGCQVIYPDGISVHPPVFGHDNVISYTIMSKENLTIYCNLFGSARKHSLFSLLDFLGARLQGSIRLRLQSFNECLRALAAPCLCMGAKRGHGRTIPAVGPGKPGNGNLSV
jgi:hypothetical protein